MADKPAVVYLVTEIVLDDGSLPPGETMDTLAKKQDEQTWGTTVPVMGIKASRKRCVPTKAHIHNGKGPCDGCLAIAYNERNASNV